MFNAKRFLILLAWTLLVIVATAALLFIFTYGDCLNEAPCRSAANSGALAIGGISFCIYWLVVILLCRRWAR